MSGGGNESPKQPTRFGQASGRLAGLAQALTVILLAATVITLFAQFHWVADLFANLRVQQMSALLGVLVVFLIARQWRWAIVAVVLMVVHASWFSVAVVPMAGGETGETQGQTLRITMVNSHTQNAHPQKVIADVLSRQADVIVILELSSALAEELSGELQQSHPHRILRPQDVGNFGIGLWSSYPIDEQDVFVTDPAIGVLSIEAVIDGHRVIATHPLPPVGPRGFTARNQQLENIAERAGRSQLRMNRQSVILVGDLNVTPWSPFFHRFQATSGLRRATGGIKPTWYVFDFFPFGLVLDHVMISPQFQCVDCRIGPNVGSDHRSVTVELQVSR